MLLTNSLYLITLPFLPSSQEIVHSSHWLSIQLSRAVLVLVTQRCMLLWLSVQTRFSKRQPSCVYLFTTRLLIYLRQRYDHFYTSSTVRETWQDCSIFVENMIINEIEWTSRIRRRVIVCRREREGKTDMSKKQSTKRYLSKETNRKSSHFYWVKL